MPELEHQPKKPWNLCLLLKAIHSHEFTMIDLELLLIIYDYCIKIFIILIYLLLFNEAGEKTVKKGKNDSVMPLLSELWRTAYWKTILRQEKPREHSRSKMQNCSGRNSLSDWREEKLFGTNKLKEKARAEIRPTWDTYIRTLICL